MKERPIIMSRDNPRLILEDKKTQTRRLVKLSAKDVLSKEQRNIGFEFFPEHARPGDFSWLGEISSRAARKEIERLKLTQHLWVPIRHPDDKNIPPEECGCARIDCPYGSAGDLLYVRETWRTRKEWDYLSPIELPIQDPTPKEDADWSREEHIEYRALNFNHVGPCEGVLHGKWRPSIHIPKWASRIWLEILKVRVERLQDISREDAISEGIPWCDYQNKRGDRCERCGAHIFSDDGEPAWHSPIVEYQLLWDSLHGKGAWDKNPWVWAIEFKKL